MCCALVRPKHKVELHKHSDVLVNRFNNLECLVVLQCAYLESLAYSKKIAIYFVIKKFHLDEFIVFNVARHNVKRRIHDYGKDCGM